MWKARLLLNQCLSAEDYCSAAIDALTSLRFTDKVAASNAVERWVIGQRGENDLCCGDTLYERVSDEKDGIVDSWALVDDSNVIATAVIWLETVNERRYIREFDDTYVLVTNSQEVNPILEEVSPGSDYGGLFLKFGSDGVLSEVWAFFGSVPYIDKLADRLL